MAKQKIILSADEYIARIREQRTDSVNRYRIKKKSRMIAMSNRVQNSEKTYIDNDDFTIYLRNASKYSQITILTSNLIDRTSMMEWIKSFDFTKNQKSVRISADREPIVMDNVPLIDIDDFCTALVIHMRRMLARTRSAG